MKQNTQVSTISPATEIPSKLGLLPWVMWSLGAVFFCYEYCLQVSPSVMTNEIMREFKVNASELGNLSAFYLYAYTLMQIPVGILLDKYGPRRLLTLAILFCATGAILIGTAQTFSFAALGRFMIGIGSSFAPVGCMYLAATWLPLNRFALMTGVMLTIGMLGAVGGEAPLSMLIAKLGWRETLILFGGIGILLSVIIWSVIRDKSLGSRSYESANEADFFAGLRNIFKNKQIWITSIFGGLMYLPTPAFAGLWGVPFLMSSYSLPRTTAAFFISWIFIGWAVGAPLLGWFSDRIGRRRPPMAIGCIGALISIVSILYIPHLPVVIMGILLFTFGFFSSGFLPAFSVAREITPPQINATALGFVNTLNNMGGAIAQPLIGLFLDLQWQGTMTDGVRSFTISNYHFSLMTLPICIAIAMCILPFIQETYCQPIYERK